MNHKLKAHVLVVALTVAAGYAAPRPKPKVFKSPDGKLIAVVIPVDKEKGFEENESRISIRHSKDRELGMHDFSSDDGEHGYGVAEAQWTPDSQYFVCRMQNSGGHSPLYEPVVYWDRQKSRFYNLADFTASQGFSVTAPNTVNVSTWPDPEPKPASVSLGHLKPGQASELP